MSSPTIFATLRRGYRHHLLLRGLEPVALVWARSMRSHAAEPAVLRGPRSPLWGCRCGEASNWACRIRCRGCDAAGPRRIVAAAQAAAGAAKPARAGTASPTKPRARTQASPGGSRSKGKTFADVVRDLGLGETSSDDTSMDDEVADDQGAVGAREARYWRERKAAAVRAGPMAADDVAFCDAKLGEIAAVRRQARPWATRVQAATDAFRKAEAKLKTATADLAAAHAALAALEASHKHAELEFANTTAALAVVKAEVAPTVCSAASPLPATVDDALRALQQAAREAGLDAQVLTNALQFATSGRDGAMAVNGTGAAAPDADPGAARAGASATAPGRPSQHRSRSRVREE